MNNVKELQAKMAALYAQVESKSVPLADAKVLSDIAGKIIAASAVQVKYYAMQKTKPRIAFLATRGNSDEVA